MDDRLTYDEALEELDRVGADLAGKDALRDETIRRTRRAGVSKSEIARRLKVGRPTVIKVLRESSQGGTTQ